MCVNRSLFSIANDVNESIGDVYGALGDKSLLLQPFMGMPQTLLYKAKSSLTRCFIHGFGYGGV